MSGLRLKAFTVLLPGTARPLFRPLTLAIAPGEVFTVTGPSGIGKSTLIEAIGGHLGAGFRTLGTATLDGTDLLPLRAERRRIGVLFQDALLFPHLSVGDNLGFGLPRGSGGRRARRTRVEEALDQAGLAGFHDRDPATLSGGQRTRAALMRTLLAEPRALLLDEPFASLDAALRDEIRAFVFARVRDRAIPALLVSHDPADRLAAAGPGAALEPG